MRVKVFNTAAQRAAGLQHYTEIPADTVFVFVGPFLAGQFHSRNVPEPFDLLFLAKDLSILARKRMVPPHDTFATPPGAMYAVEAKSGIITTPMLYAAMQTVQR